MFSKIFFRNHIYWDVFENLTFRKFPAIRYVYKQPMLVLNPVDMLENVFHLCMHGCIDAAGIVFA